MAKSWQMAMEGKAKHKVRWTMNRTPSPTIPPATHSVTGVPFNNISTIKFCFCTKYHVLVCLNASMEWSHYFIWKIETITFVKHFNTISSYGNFQVLYLQFLGRFFQQWSKDEERWRRIHNFFFLKKAAFSLGGDRVSKFPLYFLAQ